MNDTTEELLERARALGAEHGRAGGTWVTDGNTTDATYRDIIDRDEEGDPEWWDRYGPASGPLSGEWADDMSPDSLLRELGIDLGTLQDWDSSQEFEASVCDAYEQAYYDAWRDEVLRMARYQVGES